MKKDFAEYVKERCAERHLSLSELAKKANISRATLHNLLNGSTSMAKLSTVLALASVLRVHPIILFRHLLAELEFPVVKDSSAKYQFDSKSFVRDVTITSHSFVMVNSIFKKTWEIQNTGAVPWIGRKLLCMDRKTDEELMISDFSEGVLKLRGSLKPTNRAVEIPGTFPSEIVCVTVEFIAPSYPCTVVSCWKMIDEAGDICFPKQQPLICLVNVIEF